MAGSATSAIPETEMVETDRGPVFYYTVKKGDTLWDLSQKFYNSQWVWPGLWEMNDQIKNPHQIYPGDKIRIYLAEEPASPAPPPVPRTAHLKTASIPMAPPEKIPEPAPLTHGESIQNLSFIKEDATAPLGHILMAENNGDLLSNGDTVFITPVNKNTFIPGNRYHIFSTRKVTAQYDKIKFNGVKHQVKGTLTILESKNTFTRGVIDKVFRPAEPGDPIMAYFPLEKQIIPNHTPHAVDARIICAQDDNELLGEGSIAFMDAGIRNNVKPGDIYTLYSTQTRPSSSLFKKPPPLPPLKNGTLMVLHTEATAATVKILSTNTEVLINDLVK